MDDSDYVCPLCCEELDISDREFYPCKCGYQVCMWCWHRIRESESGLCPACRTPYGEDPHQFSAIDVEQVLLKAAASANKEKKEAAAKNRERQRHSIQDGGGAIGAGDLSSHLHNMEVPKDRSQLANMRVIRRNLVYAVGLPPNIANEETLKRPEYFGQYGRIAKIVINRTQVTNPTTGGVVDARRASASAYVTFVHKEDTLACILALDGFYLDGRNIRASYGTSKYCSAFIKNVRCNNPECTYLHEMGASEDTFTKQEIQAGYVTSGRDVLARQQQIVAEQMRTGQTGVAPRKKVGGGGPSGTGRVATTCIFPAPEYDEPSKPSPPLVPPPAGVSRSVTAATVGVSLNPANIAAKLGRSNSVGVATTSGGKSPPLVSASNVPPPPAVLRKSHSSGTNTAMTTTAPVTGAAGPAPAAASATTAAAVVASGRSSVKSSSESSSNDHANTTLTPLTPLKRTSKTASARAPISVAGGPQQPMMSDGGTTIPTTASTITGEKLTPLRNGTNKRQNSGARNGGNAGALAEAPSIPTMSNPQQAQSASNSSSDNCAEKSLAMIGGDVIGPPNLKPRASPNVLTGFVGADALGGSLPSSSSAQMMDALSGLPIGGLGSSCISSSGTGSVDSSSSSSLLTHRSSALGGEIFTGQLPSGSKSAIGSSSHNKWSSGSVAGPIGGSVVGGIGHVGGLPLNSGPLLSGPSGPGLFHDSYNPHSGGGVGGGVNLMSNLTPGPVGGTVIGAPRQNSDSRFPNTTNSSSALASILGINLPTGSGSLQESSVLWASSSISSNSSHPTPAPSPLAALNSNAIPSQDFFGNGGGRPLASHSNGGSSVIGGIPIGGAPIIGVCSSSQGTIGGGVVSNNTNDIALLQSLLPGVHITSGTEALGFGGGGGVGNTIGASRGGVGGGGWPGSAVVAPPGGPSSLVGLGPSGLHGDVISGGVGWNTTNGGGSMSHHHATAGSSIGAIGQNVNVGGVGSQGHHHQRSGPGMW